MKALVWMIVIIVGFYIFVAGTSTNSSEIENLREEISTLETNSSNRQECIDSFNDQRLEARSIIEDHGDTYYDFASALEDSYSTLESNPFECDNYL